jgi:hypothetical protein
VAFAHALKLAFIARAELRMIHVAADVEDLYPRADPVGTLLHYLDTPPPDLVVRATHQRAGTARWLHRWRAVQGQ